jgi:phenylacetate-CoA ligase
VCGPRPWGWNLTRAAWSHPELRVTDRNRSPVVIRSQQRAIEQFHRAAARVPLYRRLLADRRIKPARVTDIEGFQATVPVITKRDVFASQPLASLLADRAMSDVVTLISSSGLTASSFSLGMIDRTGTQAMVESFDRYLDARFQTTAKNTFLINTCAMGVSIPTSLPSINLSVRSDKALALLRALRPYYRQFVVTSDVYFLKKLVEDGRNAGVPWSRWPVQFLMGGEWFPESYREYLAGILQVNLDRPRPRTHVLGSMGAAELGFNLCFETHDTVRLRRLAVADERVRQALFGPTDTVPMIGHYDPRRWFIELTPVPQRGSSGGAFVFTSLDMRAAMPLVRYQTGDCGHLFSHSHVRRILTALKFEAYIPTSTDPILAVAGRRDQSVTVGNRAVRMEFLRSILYANRTLAALTTGQFTATRREGRLQIRVQLQAGSDPAQKASLQARLSTMFNRYVPSVVQAVPYFDFHEAIGVDYERKFNHKAQDA